MRALSIRQPYAELILRGIKRIEYRSRRTNIVGERFWIYAPQRQATERRSDAATKGEGIWSRDLGGAAPPPWIVELANAMEMFPHALPVGVIVGSAVIDRVVPLQPTTNHQQPTTLFEWHLRDVERAKTLRKPKRQPQPVWFRPF